MVIDMLDWLDKGSYRGDIVDGFCLVSPESFGSRELDLSELSVEPIFRDGLLERERTRNK